MSNDCEIDKMSGDDRFVSKLVFFVNGKKIEEDNPDPEWTLLFYLRRKLNLCGTKLGCSEGGCGACTVMVSKYDHNQKESMHLAVNACLAPVCSMHGLAVTTVEGIGSTKTRLHPVQERIAKAHGSQCGFCTPGIVMSMYALLRTMPKPSYSDLEVAFQGNLCRCTGYRPILEGYKTFVEDWEKNRIQNSNGTCALGDKCCKVNGRNQEMSEPTFDASKFTPYDPSQEPIFPPELALTTQYKKQNLLFKGDNVTWYRPIAFEDLLKLKYEHKDARIVTGNTEVGVEVKFKNCLYPVIIAPDQIEELNQIEINNNGLTVGASATLTQIENVIKSSMKNYPEYKMRIFKAILDMLNWFAGKQIRNVACLGGNIMTGSPISDLNPILMAANSVLNVRSVQGSRKVIMDENFFIGYRKNVILPEEVLVSIEIPFSKPNQHFKAFKQAKRREDDIAIVNMALSVELTEDLKIMKSNLCFGGMAAIIVTAKNTCNNMMGLKWSDAILPKINNSLLEELKLDPDAPGGMIRYRQSLALSLFFKAFMEICQDLEMVVDDKDRSAIGGFKHHIQKGSQYFNIPIKEESSVDPVGFPIPHLSAFKQTTGEAVYCDDMPAIEGELYISLVLATKSHAKLVSVDATAALKMSGVIDFISARTLEKNIYFGIAHDEELFVSNTVITQGQIIGIVVAKDQSTAQKAANLVNVVYDELKPIITIHEAIAAKSYFPGYPKTICRGDVDKAFEEADFIIEDELHVGGQEHFYLETQSCRVVPKEDDELEVFCSAQSPTEVCKSISEALNIPINRISVKVKRIGGGFGGKENRTLLVAIPVAIAAHKHQKPVRCMLDRDEDMIITGKRHPFHYKYKIAANRDGRIIGAIIELYNNAGCSIDLSAFVLERSMLHCENAYFIPNMKVTGYVCKTNIPSNTALRGFGAPQAMLLAETYIREVAQKLNMNIIDVISKNLYTEGQLTHYNQALERCNLQRCLEECLQKSDYYNRKAEVEEYNRQSRWKKRGIAIVPTKYGISFPIKFLNQAGALIHVYTDGSVLLTHGGTEMGQGLHTKMIQIASKALNIDASKIYTSETSTDKVPNTSPTAGSVSSDLNGMAVLNACNTIMDRLKPVIDKNPNGSWEDWVGAAYFNCISLSATGYYADTTIDYSLSTNTGRAYNYFTYGVGCSEVEIDCLTGDHQVIRTDIVMDVGDSLNPAIDIGQIEGAFVQGYGLFTMEELVFSPKGTLYSRGPGTYKLPGFGDVPKEFNVSLLKGAANPRAVHSSKAVGEPPLFLSASVFFAIKEAIISYRLENGASSCFRLDSPATVERIRMACQDHITNQIKEEEHGKFTPWNIEI